MTRINSTPMNVVVEQLAEVNDMVYDTGQTVYDLAIGLAEFLIANLGLLSGPPEPVLGMILVVGGVLPLAS